MIGARYTVAQKDAETTESRFVFLVIMLDRVPLGIATDFIVLKVSGPSSTPETLPFVHARALIQYSRVTDCWG